MGQEAAVGSGGNTVNDVSVGEDPIITIQNATTSEDTITSVHNSPTGEDIVTAVHNVPTNEDIVTPVHHVPTSDDIVTPVHHVPTREDIVTPVHNVPTIEDIMTPDHNVPTTEDTNTHEHQVDTGIRLHGSKAQLHIPGIGVPYDDQEDTSDSADNVLTSSKLFSVRGVPVQRCHYSLYPPYSFRCLFEISQRCLFDPITYEGSDDSLAIE